MKIKFENREGDELFTSNHAQALPAAGQLVVYCFNINDRDHWDPEELRRLRNLNASRWRVLDVIHEFGRHEVLAESHYITVRLVPYQKKAHID